MPKEPEKIRSLSQLFSPDSALTASVRTPGCFLYDNTGDDDRKGIRVLDRKDIPDGEATENLAEMVEDIVSYSKTEITERKHNARKLAQLTSWEKLGENYKKAHKMALEDEK
ncbi:MAG: hypothetical protein BRC27_01555 [Nanohaloarchaea archaeon SW_10_44_10]|nr:MAG: hypothetical protein BRC27_01555 [Nanohaloarchaea archaeon SW_10_44_10]